MSCKLEMALAFDAIEAGVAVQLLLDQWEKDNGAEVQSVNLFQERTTVGRLKRVLRGKKFFVVAGEGFEFRLAAVRNSNLSFLSLSGVEGSEWNYVRRIHESCDLISARIYNTEYEFWQNAEDPLEYRTRGRSMRGLPMRHNGLPAPLNQMIVDTTGNPGRRVLRDGYIEAVGNRMWVGPSFFERVPHAEKAQLESANWLTTKSTDEGLLEITAADCVFVEETPTQLQDQLRELLFPSM